jgi:hypothetical protein
MVTLDSVQSFFVNRLPVLRKMASISFRGLPPEAKEECITNSIALAWKSFYGLFLKGRADEPGLLDSCLRYSIRQSRAGRLPQGCPRKRDTLAPRWVGPTRMADFDINEFVGRNTSIPDAVVFRVDVPTFMGTLTQRQRKLAADLASGVSTSEAASEYGVTPGAISQFRVRFKKLFDAFFSE